MKKYKELCQKNQEENYLLDKYVFRKISIFLTVVCIRFKATPNQITCISLLASLCSLYFLTSASGVALLFAAGLIFLYFILDHVDGELARYYIRSGKQKPSLKGKYFDVLVHRYSSNLMVFFLGVGLYNLYGYKWAVLVGFLACIGVSSFPNVVASQVIASKIAREPEIIYDEKMKAILLEIEKKSQQISAVHGGMVQKTKKLVIESLFFPGHIILLILVLIGDVFLDDFVFNSLRFNLRLLFLLAMAFLYTLKTIVQGIIWIYKLRQIPM